MAEAIVSIVVGRLTDLLIEEPHLLHGVKDEIEQVVTELRRMKTYLKDADSRISEYKVRKMVVDIRELAYNAEHVVESFLLKASSTKKPIQWINTWKFSRKIKVIQRKMSLLFNCFRDYNIGSTIESPEASSSSYGIPGKLKRFCSYTTVEPEIFVAHQGDVDILVAHLVDESVDCYPLISICGMGGLGKTTLAQKIYNHSTVRTYFSGNLAWVSVSQKWQTKYVLQRILICLVHEKKEEILKMDDDKLAENLLEIQQKRRCLIVLDDIWSTDAWDSLKAAFTAKKSLSKLMLTSRNVDVPRHVNQNGLIHRPALLNAEQSWELLRLKALPRGDYIDSRDVKRMEEVGRKMVRNCAGLPLAIVVLGGILVTKPSLAEWEKVDDDFLSSLAPGRRMGEDHQREVLDILVRSYNDLPHQLKSCYLYLGKFGEDEQIEVETLYQLWIAEGLVLSSDKMEGETMMQVAESYMGELVHKSMVQVKLNLVEPLLTKFTHCNLHDLMRDLCLSQARLEDFFKVLDLREGCEVHLNQSVDYITAYTPQLVVHFDESSTTRNANPHLVKKVYQQQYRSLIVLTEFSVSFPPLLSSRLQYFKFLRVLSLEDVRLYPTTLFRLKLGCVLGNLVYLRYLSVRNTCLLGFPSVENLVLLQTLKVDTNFIIFFPPWLSRNTLGKLGQLRHLYLPNWTVCKLWRNSKLKFNGLSKLETLENFDSDWCEVKDLPKLIGLQKLTVKVNERFNDVEEIMKCLASLDLSSSSCLRFLGLLVFIKNLRLRNPDILRQLLWDRKFKLQELSIIGQLPELGQLFEQQQQHPQNSKTVASLNHITILSLYDCLLEEDPMPVLEKIPTLSVLSLCQESYMGKEMVCSAMGFPKLTRLRLDRLPNLTNWRLEVRSMPIVTDLIIGGCLKLEELPEGLIHLNSLRELNLVEMRLAFCDRLRLVNGEQGPHFYKVAHIPSFCISSIVGADCSSISTHKLTPTRFLFK